MPETLYVWEDSRAPIVQTLYSGATESAQTAYNLTSAAVLLKIRNVTASPNDEDSYTAGGGTGLVVTTAASGIVTWTPATGLCGNTGATFIAGHQYEMYYEITPSGGVRDYWPANLKSAAGNRPIIIICNSRRISP